MTGFLSNTANYGSVRCYQNFASGFTQTDIVTLRDFWEMGTNEQHRLNVNKILSCNSKAAKSKMEANCSSFYSVLLDLLYFDAIKMLHCFLNCKTYGP